jgi:mitogen-activated protein kinase 1/3
LPFPLPIVIQQIVPPVLFRQPAANWRIATPCNCCGDAEATLETVEPLPVDADYRLSRDDSIPEWPVPDRYRLGRVLGGGSYGCVAEAWDKESKRMVAIKRIESLYQSTAHCKRIFREVAILSHLQHSHVVQVYDLIQPTDEDYDVLHLVMERCDSDFRKVCDHPHGVSLAQARKLSHGLVVGCSYLHDVGIYHRDLKPANCLVNRDCSVKICDFNLSRTASLDESLQCLAFKRTSVECASVEEPRPLKRALTMHVASRWYRPPEVLLRTQYSEAMDVWSVGCIIAELFNALNEGGRGPRRGALFPGSECHAFSSQDSDSDEEDFLRRGDVGDQLDVIFNVLGTPSEADLESIPSEVARAQVRSYPARPGCGLQSLLPREAGQPGKDLLHQMLQVLPTKRTTMKQALRHRFFAGVPCRQEDVHPMELDFRFDEAELDRTASGFVFKLRPEVNSSGSPK